MKRLIFPVLGGIGLLAVILWFAGVFGSETIDPDTSVIARDARLERAATTSAELTTIVDYYEAVGTVRPRTETVVESLVTAKVLEVRVAVGDRVSQGDVLVVLDSRELTAKRDQAVQGLEAARSARGQAEQAINAAQASFNRASADYRRMRTLYDEGAITSQEMGVAEAEYLQAEALLRQARDGLSGAQAAVDQAEKILEQAEIGLGYAEIKAHEDGEIARRDVEPGDLAVPGKQLLVMHTAGTMRFEALVREGLIDRTRPGVELEVMITALSARTPAIVEEVAPMADPRTRTFLVKVGLPPMNGLYSGMFGRLLVPMAEREAVMLDENAVQRVGQLTTVEVLESVGEDAVWRTVFVTTGQSRQGRIEILSGLAGGEVVALPYMLEDQGSIPEQETQAGEGQDG
ncbi:MAG: efflux RND transporter periplasmic adaptor subunit [Desulfovibrio sp.]|nr:MAG: efflux RND transporter periplasmic adaptor subunit [Desulfovibrio sp.]